MPTNTAAWMGTKYGQLEVGPAPYTPPGDDQIVVHNQAVAVNPLDWIIQSAGPIAYRWLSYPAVIGSDVAGEVVEVGKAVTRFRVGDRVLGHAVGTDKDSNHPAEGAFQDYAVVLERLASPIPDTLSYESACGLPLALSTASCGLFQTDQLALRHPTAGAEPTGQTVLIWGGSTSVGSNAIQLAVAAGYDVITTASPHNVAYVTSLGAAQVFDSTARRWWTTSSPPSGTGPSRAPWRWGRPPPAPARTSSGPRGIGTKFIFRTSLKTNEVSSAIYQDFLPALAEGRYTAAPEPSIVGHSLGDVQHAMDVQRNGVSAQKVVVSLTPNGSEA